MQIKIDELEQEKLELEEVVDRIDQSNRHCNLRVFGLKEKPTENTREELQNLFRTKMHVNLKDDEIELCYRIGNKETSRTKNKAIFLKLSNRNVKETLYKQKKLLKGSGISHKRTFKWSYRKIETEQCMDGLWKDLRE
nr:unnamed protein product [Callosobruchus analis]